MTYKPSENYELNLAGNFVQYTGSHIFLTGKAGTGKTTFSLILLLEPYKMAKNMVCWERSLWAR